MPVLLFAGHHITKSISWSAISFMKGGRTMFEKLFRSADGLARHRDGPFAEDRRRFLERCSQEGFSPGYLSGAAHMLLGIASELDASPGRSMTLSQIRSAANRWCRLNYRHEGPHGHQHHQRERFIKLAVNWFRFLGRFSETPEAPDPFSEFLQDYMVWMEEECGLAMSTIDARLKTAREFLKWYDTTSGRPFSAVRLTDIDDYLARFAERGWSRTSIAGVAGVLRVFFRHAGRRGWCHAEIAGGIKGPRLYSQENLPMGPPWKDVRRLLASLNTDDPGHIRDFPMVMLCAVYGLRPSEVVRLRLEDLDWEHDQIRVRRSKVNKTQVYPMVPQVGNAILRYLKEIRPRSAHREVFLTRVGPIRPVTARTLGHATSERLRALGIRLSRYGAYSLRHACATHLASQGLSFKIIGDHLGHSSPDSTRIYAKVDLPMLRKVAALDLEGVK
jgi:site-specific recombinase XerD